MKFTIRNQKSNSISRTTEQTIKHFIYSNNEITISGMEGKHSVWHKTGNRISRKIEDLNIIDAVDFANKLYLSI